MGAGERAVQLVAGARGHDVFAVADVVADGAPERELARLAVGDGHEVHAEGDLQIAVLEQVGQHLFRVGVLFQLDHGAHAGAVALVADVVDAAQRGLFLLAELEDLLQHRRLVHLIGDLGDDDQLSPGGPVLDVRARAKRELSAPRLVGGAQLRRVDEHAPGGKVRPRHQLH